MTSEFQKIKITENSANEFAARETRMAESLGDVSGVTARLVANWKIDHIVIQYEKVES